MLDPAQAAAEQFVSRRLEGPAITLIEKSSLPDLLRRLRPPGIPAVTPAPFAGLAQNEALLKAFEPEIKAALEIDRAHEF